MPYTFAHPGFTLPFKKRKPALFSTTGLIFGSIAPDYDIILRFTNSRFHILQYDLKSILCIIFPIAFFSAIYFHLVIRNVLIYVAPQNLKKHLKEYRTFDYILFLRENYVKVSFSILFAIYLHLFLDYITHWNAYLFKLYAQIYYGNNDFLPGIFYYTAMYFPLIFFSLLGFYYMFTFLEKYKIRIADLKEGYDDKRMTGFYAAYIIITIVFTILKIRQTGIEKGFVFDSYILSLTNGLLISFYCTPLVFIISKKIRSGDGDE